MAKVEYSDTESYSESESSDSDIEIESVLKKIDKQPIPEVKGKRSYVRKPMTDSQIQVMADKLAKARAARKANQDIKRQKAAQEKAELDELVKLKKEGKLKVKKEKPANVEIPKEKKEKKQVVIKEIHHHYKEPQQEKPSKPKAAIAPVRQIPKMIYA